MTTQSIHFEHSDPWILLSLKSNGELSDLWEILAKADNINHTIPFHEEINDGYTRLNNAGLIHSEGKKIGLSLKGCELISELKSNNYLDNWTEVELILSSRKYVGVINKSIHFSSDEFKQAYKIYRIKFNKAFEEINKTP